MQRFAGGGKTLILLSLVQKLGRRCLVLVHKSFFGTVESARQGMSSKCDDWAFASGESTVGQGCGDG